MNREEVYKSLKIKKSEQKVVDKAFDYIRDNCGMLAARHALSEVQRMVY